jgi:multisubunit Na+/H+ antiporter MnhG subunit
MVALFSFFFMNGAEVYASRMMMMMMLLLLLAPVSASTLSRSSSFDNEAHYQLSDGLLGEMILLA